MTSRRRAILEQVAPDDPQEGLQLHWRFMALAGSVIERCDDSSGVVIGVFKGARDDLGQLAEQARPQPEALAGTILDALQNNGYAQYDGLIGIMAPALGEDGLAHLKVLVEDLGKTPMLEPPEEEWRAVAWGPDGTTYAHESRERERDRTVSMALKDIADAKGDVDGFIAQYAPKARKTPAIAAEIARRLLAAGRAEDALGFVERAEVSEDRWIPREWKDARVEALEALGRAEEAQTFRWACFQRDLSTEYLRAYLKRLPDFDDIEAEDRAMGEVMAHPSLMAALRFFLDWPAFDKAAALLITRHEEFDGDRYESLSPAAEALAERHPLAATLALRAMIDFTLSKARSKRYRYAAEHLATCAGLADEIEDFGAFEAHAAYVARLRERHGRKFGFWSLAKADG